MHRRLKATAKNCFPGLVAKHNKGKIVRITLWFPEDSRITRYKNASLSRCGTFTSCGQVARTCLPVHQNKQVIYCVHLCPWRLCALVSNEPFCFMLILSLRLQAMSNHEPGSEIRHAKPPRIRRSLAPSAAQLHVHCTRSKNLNQSHTRNWLNPNQTTSILSKSNKKQSSPPQETTGWPTVRSCTRTQQSAPR